MVSRLWPHSEPISFVLSRAGCCHSLGRAAGQPSRAPRPVSTNIYVQKKTQQVVYIQLLKAIGGSQISIKRVKYSNECSMFRVTLPH